LIERRAILAGLDNGSFLSEAPTRWTLNLRSPLVTQYGAATTFGTPTDFVKLFIVSTGSSSVAGVVAVVLFGRGPAAWYG